MAFLLRCGVFFVLSSAGLALSITNCAPRNSVTFFDVGQGDAALLVTQAGKHIVVDGGPGNVLLSPLAKKLPLLKQTIELLVLTHPDLDHVGAFPKILEHFNVGSVLLPPIADNLAEYQFALEMFHNKSIPIIFANPEVDIHIDNMVLDVLWPSAGASMGKNNNSSLVFMVLGTPIKVLFTGDIEKSAESALLNVKEDLDADILKIAHHGSKTSSSTGFLLAVGPRIAVISSGKENRYGHPHVEVLNRLQKLGIQIRRTDTEGTIMIPLVNNGHKALQE